MTAYEVLKDILEQWNICELYYFDFYKDDYIVRYGRKGYNYERQMTKEEFYILFSIVGMLGYGSFTSIFNNIKEGEE